MSEKLDPEKITPTGKYQFLLEDVDPSEWPNGVTDYSMETIKNYVYPDLIRDRPIAEFFSDWLWDTLSEWNEGTDMVATWGEIIEAGMRHYRDMFFPPQKDE